MLRPTCVRDARGEGVQGEAALVDPARAWGREDTGAYEAAGRCFRDADGFGALFEEAGDLLEDLADFGRGK